MLMKNIIQIARHRHEDHRMTFLYFLQVMVSSRHSAFFVLFFFSLSFCSYYFWRLCFVTESHKLTTDYFFDHISFLIWFRACTIRIIFHHRFLIASISAREDWQQIARRIVKAVTIRKSFSNLISILVDSTILTERNISCISFSVLSSPENSRCCWRLWCIVHSGMLSCW